MGCNSFRARWPCWASPMKSPRISLSPVRRKIGSWKSSLNAARVRARHLFNLQAGEHVNLLCVAGHGFDLKHQRGSDLVFVAMGTGVAPLRSALRHVLNRKGDFGQLVVLYG